MGTEIERRFLAGDGPWRESPAHRLVQGYLSLDPARAVRVRIRSDPDGSESAFLTVKGAAAGAVRSEFEYAIPPADARAMLDEMAAGTPIDKTRHRWHDRGHCWEVDVFHGANAGLVVAEVELEDPGERLALPAWIVREITGDHRYSNVALARLPFTAW